MIDESWLKENSKIVELPDGSIIHQHKEGQKVSSDNVLLNKVIMAEYSRQSGSVLHVLELGSGNGINSIMLKKRFPHWEVAGIEIDDELVTIAQLNCKIQNLNIKIVKADLRQYPVANQYDLIVANPPYKKVNSGRLSLSSKNNVAKFELSCTMDDILSVIKRGLKPTGKAWLLYSLERKNELRLKINEYKLKVTELIKENKVLIVGIEYDTDK